MPSNASPALGNGAANPPGLAVQRGRSSFFPQAVAQPDADARALYLSHCYFWPLSHRRLRGAPAAAGGVTARKHLRALCSGSWQRPMVPVHAGLPHVLSPLPGLRARNPEGIPVSALHVSWRGGCLVLGHCRQQLTLSPVVTSKNLTAIKCLMAIAKC